MGVGALYTLEEAERFLADTAVTFPMLWSEAIDPWRHYDIYTGSDVRLLDPTGERVGGRSMAYSPAAVESLLRTLE